MRYISLTDWRDLTDDHTYHEGDTFPFDGREIAEERLAELESGHNRAGLRLIRAIDAGNGPAEDRKEEEPETGKEAQTEASAEEPDVKEPETDLETEPEAEKPKRSRSRK